MDDLWEFLGYISEQVEWFFVDLSNCTENCIFFFSKHIIGSD